jgi:hypothetical protein
MAVVGIVVLLCSFGLVWVREFIVVIFIFLRMFGELGIVFSGLICGLGDLFAVRVVVLMSRMSASR